MNYFLFFECKIRILIGVRMVWKLGILGFLLCELCKVYIKNIVLFFNCLKLELNV